MPSKATAFLPHMFKAEANAEDECRAWICQLIDARDEVVAFVDARLYGKGTGDFHIGFRGHRPSVLIHFAKPGHAKWQWRTKKAMNEVHIIQYLRQHTTIPLPYIPCWGLTEESPRQLGSFIIMDFIAGARLSTFLKQSTKDEDAEMVLNPAFRDETLYTIHNQLADCILQISRLEFSLIGAISKDASETWAVTNRPLTYDINELATGTGYSVAQLPTAPFHRTSNFFQSVSNQRLFHLETQQSLAKDEADVRRRFIARHRFKQPIPEYGINGGNPFKVFCNDMQPAHMLTGLKTLQIAPNLNFEFTDSMPASPTYGSIEIATCFRKVDSQLALEPQVICLINAKRTS
ncbi:hypothetical protein B0J13DRAFT_650261 [Dactylonectria estremocensis]|uniref:Aminoglycoside phosphotransferase domain-containing protein n=1 Tax=Dactylonectria estremocensis TaxID=1079267 RepID=A0A9P9FBI1_9HYPO|nr:hypothetical protein B0J13DRAFT_650261 [Dactylonectria estremocensis]